MARAETLILKNGKRVEGKIIEETDKAVKVEMAGIGVTYFKDEIDSVEKVVPAIVVKDEQQKQEVIKKLVDEKAVDRIYDVTVEKKSKAQSQAQETIHHQQEEAETLNEEGRPLPNAVIQFKSPEEVAAEEQERLNRMTAEERKQYEAHKAAAEKFYDER